jgi:riboflavin kinase / FMN adenylyltransferase
MKVIRNIREFPKDTKVSVCIGNFDGIHMGHLDIIKACKENEGVPAVITFDRHPREVLFPDFPLKKLTLKHEKYSFLKELGIKMVLELSFSDFCSMEALKFLDFLHSSMNIGSITVGFNFFFGKDQKGTSDLLFWWGRSSGVKINVLQPTVKDGIRLSSTVIRELVVSGQIEKADSFMSFPFVLSGKIIKGRQLGREMNFPTLNMEPPEKILPPDGVYITATVIEGMNSTSLTNIGRNPTIDNDSFSRKIETWIVDRYLEEFYDRHASVYFFKKIRNEIKFSSREKLYEKVSEDKEEFYRFWSDTKTPVLPDTSGLAEEF